MDESTFLTRAQDCGLDPAEWDRDELEWLLAEAYDDPGCRDRPRPNPRARLSAEDLLRLNEKP